MLTTAAVPSVRTERIAVAIAVAAFAGFLVGMAAASVPQLDDWYEVAWWRQHDFTLANLAAFASYNYMNYNPRIGETLLALVDGPVAVTCVVVPIAQLVFLVIAFLLAHGRRPRATFADLGRLAVVQAVVWLAIPIPGVIYFYRPYCANYLIAGCVQFGFLACYRVAIDRSIAMARPRAVAYALGALAWGVVAGMANEHTGPTAIVAALGFAAWARRGGRLRAWMVTGVAGLAVGFLALIAAPGQAVRYAGVGGVQPVHILLERGVWGNLQLVGYFAVEIAPAVVAVAAAIGLALRRGSDAVTALDRARVTRAAVAIVAALGVIATAFGSPIVEDRVFFAPCVLAAIALATVAEAAWQDRAARAALVVGAAAVVAINAVGFAVSYRRVAARVAARDAQLAAGPAGADVAVTPVDQLGRDHWTYGEDFANAYVREFVAHHVYDLDDIALADFAWAQPTPPETVHVALTYQPPLAGQPGASWPAHGPTPAQWPWLLRELRESWAELTGVAGHELVAIDAVVLPPQPVPGGRPIHLARWQTGKFAVIDPKIRNDAHGWPYAWVRTDKLPLQPTEAYVQACGETVAVAIEYTDDELRVPMRYRCAGNHSVFVCDPHDCWLAWRYW
jgi:hypothetical protein